MRPYLTLHHPSRARAYYAAGLWRGETFYDLMCGHAERHPDRIALRDGRQRLTWGELAVRVERVAAALAETGLTGGDRVSVWLSNRIDTLVIFLACSRNGYACNPSLHRSHTRAEVIELLARLSTRVLVTEGGWGAERLPFDSEHFLTRLPELRRVHRPEDLGADGIAPASHPVADPDKVVYLAFTSGTTGLPKCVMHSDNTLLANARDLVRDWGYGVQTRLLTLSPLSHHIAWVAAGQWLLSGCELITDDPPEGMSRLDWIIETGATYVMGVPTHAIDILAEQRRRGLDRLGRVDIFYMAGAPIPPTVAKAFVEQGIRPQNVYGMTENSSHQYTHPDDDIETVTATCGRGGAAYKIRLFDPADPDTEVQPGAEGHVGGRGASLMLGYFDNQMATEASFNRDGWFLSGDLGRLDGNGNLRIEGRLKDIIIRGGHNIYPAQIEALAIRCPEVEKAAVVPMHDERLGERACIAVIGTVMPEKLLAHLATAGLSRYDMPEYFLRLDVLPLSASGKPLKRVLIDQIRSGALVPEAIGARKERAS
ncbi:MAG: AMP-binding protein [Alphaproteobacteria bacterium]|nr:AMP-binding protein [Alphaproteobacteria bacterium]